MPIRETRRLVVVLAAACASLILLLLIIIVTMSIADDDGDDDSDPTADAPQTPGHASSSPLFGSLPHDIARNATHHYPQDDPQPFSYVDEHRISGDATLVKDPILVAAAEALFEKNYDAAIENLLSVDDQYKSHPNFLRLCILAYTGKENYQLVIETFNELLSIVPDAMRNPFLRDAAKIVLTSNAHTSSAFSEMLKTHTSLETASAIANNITHANFISSTYKTRLHRIYNVLPNEHLEPWLKLAVELWMLPNGKCAERLALAKELADLNIPKLEYLRLLKLINTTGGRSSCKRTVTKGRGPFRENVTEKYDCSSCMRSFVKDEIARVSVDP